MFKELSRLLCGMDIHTHVKDFFVEELVSDAWYKDRRTGHVPVALIRQCMHCKQVVNKPQFTINNPHE